MRPKMINKQFSSGIAHWHQLSNEITKYYLDLSVAKVR